MMTAIGRQQPLREEPEGEVLAAGAEARHRVRGRSADRSTASTVVATATMSEFWRPFHPLKLSSAVV